MSILLILQIVMAAGTSLTGLLALLNPKAITGFIGLEPRGGRGISEIRSIFGAAFIALGAAPLVLGLSDPAFTMLGIMYLTVAGVRTVSIFVDGASEQSSWISMASEVVAGVILVL